MSLEKARGEESLAVRRDTSVPRAVDSGVERHTQRVRIDLLARVGQLQEPLLQDLRRSAFRDQSHRSDWSVQAGAFVARRAPAS